MTALVASTMLLALACTGDASAAGDEGAGPAPAASSGDGASRLFVVQGRTARAERVGTAWQLSVKVPDGRVVWFTDRPLRRASHTTVQQLVKSWKAFGFTDDPPNAALTGVRDATEHDVVVELRKPAWDASRKMLTFRARPLRDGTRIPSKLDDVSLFVDNAQQTIQVNLVNLTQVSLQIQSAEPDVSTWTSDQSPGIGFDFGAGSANGPSLNVGYVNPTPGVSFEAQLMLVGNYGNTWQLSLEWDGSGDPSATLTQFGGQGIALLNQQTDAGVPVVLQNLNPDLGGTAIYQVILGSSSS